MKQPKKKAWLNPERHLCLKAAEGGQQAPEASADAGVAEKVEQVPDLTENKQKEADPASEKTQESAADAPCCVNKAGNEVGCSSEEKGAALQTEEVKASDVSAEGSVTETETDYDEVDWEEAAAADEVTDLKDLPAHARRRILDGFPKKRPFLDSARCTPSFLVLNPNLACPLVTSGKVRKITHNQDLYGGYYSNSPSPPRQADRQAASGQEQQVCSGEGAPATLTPVRYQPSRQYQHARSLPRHYTPGTVRECGGCEECCGAAWEAKAEVFQLEAEQRRLDAARTELDNQWRAVKERLALSRALFKSVCSHTTTLEDWEWDSKWQYSCRICFTEINGWDVCNEWERQRARLTEAGDASTSQDADESVATYEGSGTH
eukprot:505709-Rhodomonas_salina.1